MKRAELSRQFSMTADTPLKTFVVEAHADGDARALLEDLAGNRQVQDTEDIYLHRLDTPEALFFVDNLDSRFWSFHTQSSSGDAFRFLRDQIQSRRDLDWAWLPSAHLRHVWPGSTPRWLRSDFRGEQFYPEGSQVRDLRVEVGGTDADELVALIESNALYAGAISFDRVALSAADPNFGAVREGVNRIGRFVASGESFELHQAIVGGVVARYRRLIEAVERRALEWAELADGGAAMAGGAVVVTFSRPIPDMGLFLDELFSCREPFRLWGIPVQADSDLYEVEAVDLHVGERLRLDITPHWVRVYLFAGGCGNSVVRLAANLQHRFDGALQLCGEDLAKALAGAA